MKQTAADPERKALVGWLSLAAAGLTVIAGIIAIAQATGDDASDTAQSQPPTAASSAPTTATPSDDDLTEPVTEGPTASYGTVLISAHIDPTYTVAKDQALACPDAGTFCLVIEPELTGPDGQLGSECNLRWTVRTAGRNFDQGRSQFCDDVIYVGADKVTPAGQYKLTIVLDMDDGTQHTGSYAFELLPE